ncbi:MAG: hypothetical protein CVU42_00610 [Chloroflexi bacterium HGW-Chloroflexi-4]|jgi:putative hydrolase of the HAD superfamily|nr:MAG: hypothetical protein CVU42_00610 [Chloroflexi bacterium HGW-Chloroflexi-4]
MIKAIFFDAAGILYTRSGTTEEFANKTLKEKGYATEISVEEMEKQLKLRSKANEGSISHDVYWDQWLSMRKVTDPDQRKMLTAEIVNYSNAIQPMPGAKEALAQLKQKGIPMGIITDTMYPLEWKMRRLEKAGVAEFIDIVACSTDLGAHKPDPLVYSYAIQQAKLTPEETAFVGHLGVELEGAQKAGMTTIAINHDEGTKADFFCNSLLDLPSLSIFQIN